MINAYRFRHLEEILTIVHFFEQSYGTYEAVKSMGHAALKTKTNSAMQTAIIAMLEMFEKMTKEFEVNKPYIECMTQNYMSDRSIEHRAITSI